VADRRHVPAEQGLYDAVLLAEHVSLPLRDIRELMRPELAGIVEESLPKLDVDWDNFRDAYPGVDGDAGSWLRRLVVALSSP
jgi:hypothetical protein